ncbi:hypothetical protein PCE1_002226 [Barthelona sp. PCE]
MPPKPKGKKWRRQQRAKGKKEGNNSKKKEETVVEESSVPEVLPDVHVTSVLTSPPKSSNVVYDRVSINAHNKIILDDTHIEINQGHRYALISEVGSGKTTLLKCLAYQKFENFPSHIDIHLVEGEYPSCDITPLQAVMKRAKDEEERINQQIESLNMDNEEEAALLEQLYFRIGSLDLDTAEVRAEKILHGLGFSHDDMHERPCKAFSGGWRHRISLAIALHLQPLILLLDEPSAHLDLESCTYLELLLRTYPYTILFCSHSSDFIDNVATDCVLLYEPHRKIYYFRGNYTSYVRARANMEINQMRRYHRDQDKVKALKGFIAKYGQKSKQLSRQAASRSKQLTRMVEEGLTDRVVNEASLTFRFPEPRIFDCSAIFFQDVSFGYPPIGNPDAPPERILYDGVNISLSLGENSTKIVLVAQNGLGKSTLLRLMGGPLIHEDHALYPVEGNIRRHSHAKIGYLHQHLLEELPLEMTPLQYFAREFDGEHKEQSMRQLLGPYGISREIQDTPIGYLSSGQRVLLALAHIANQAPNVLLLDEVSNHLSIGAIDSLCNALNEYKGAVVIVSHDFRLIDKVANEIWVIENEEVRQWEGDIYDYKNYLLSKVSEDVADVMDVVEHHNE